MTAWRFDQGRLSYFQFDEIKRIARTLSAIDGISVPKLKTDLLRESLSHSTELPFAPADYTVWRNYKRVFGCQLLATEIAGKIVCTDLCHILANDEDDVDVDDYFGHFATHFHYPAPFFDGYDPSATQVFPVVAIIKFLLSRFLTGAKPCISLAEIGTHLIGNNVTGVEPLNFYAALIARKSSQDLRQTRELLKVISQFSFVKWENPYLFLEIASKQEAYEIEKLLTPKITIRQGDAGAELLRLGAGFKNLSLAGLTLGQSSIIDTEFTEGSKTRVTHLRTERSPKLKEFYFAAIKNPQICNMCDMDTARRYPWAEHIIELHHLLPLCSPVRVEASKTSIKDIVGVCPTCHRATHKFYSKWLKKNNRKDFNDYDEARHVYNEAKIEIVLR